MCFEIILHGPRGCNHVARRASKYLSVGGAQRRVIFRLPALHLQIGACHSVSTQARPVQRRGRRFGDPRVFSRLGFLVASEAPRGKRAAPKPELFVGIDLHKAFLQVAVIDSEGELLPNKRAETRSTTYGRNSPSRPFCANAGSQAKFPRRARAGGEMRASTAPSETPERTGSPNTAPPSGISELASPEAGRAAETASHSCRQASAVP